jgi:hypothetical protein
MLRMCVYMHSRFVENHLIRILKDGPLISEVVLSQFTLPACPMFRNPRRHSWDTHEGENGHTRQRLGPRSGDAKWGHGPLTTSSGAPVASPSDSACCSPCGPTSPQETLRPTCSAVSPPLSPPPCPPPSASCNASSSRMALRFAPSSSVSPTPRARYVTKLTGAKINLISNCS